VEEALYAMDWEDRYESQRYECPACGSAARLIGDVVPEWGTRSDEGDGDTSTTVLTVYFIPVDLECRLCGLHLRHGLARVGVPNEIPLPVEDVDPADFLEVDEG
jgi:hypothetical protein